MKAKLKSRIIRASVCLLLLSTINSQISTALAQGTGFTYQGRLNDSSGPANGLFDLRFRLFSDPLGNNQAGSTMLSNAVPVTGGLFMVTLDFGPGIFNGSNYWLEVDVKTNGAAAYTDLTPLQALTPAPYAVFAESAVSAGLAGGTYSNAVTLNNPSNNFSGSFWGNGANLTNVNSTTLGGLSSSNFWQTSGNSGTTPGTNFLGTTDSQPLEIWVNQARALRLEPGTNTFSAIGAPNMIGGAPNNFVDPGVIGATIAGGGALIMTGFLPGPSSNHVSAIFGTISGGRLNTVQADHATIAGGVSHTIGTFAYDSAIGGGRFNRITTGSQESVIGGGEDNTAGAYAATIAGGSFNTVGASYATVGGGYFNTANALYATVGGGQQNNLQPATANSTIAGGSGNRIQAIEFNANLGGYNSTIAGGLQNTIGSPYSTVSGGSYHWVGTNSNSATISGGYYNVIGDNTFDSTISGGSYGSIGTNSFASTLSGGSGNSIGVNATSSTVSGGYQNTVQSGSAYSSIGGGQFQTVSASFATVPGGYANSAAGNYSFAAGKQAQANHDGAYVWADSQSGSFGSTAPNQFLIRASGGVGINTNSPWGAGLNVAGTVRASLFQGDGSALFNVGAGALGNYAFAAVSGFPTVITPNFFQDIAFAADAQLNGWVHTASTPQYTNSQTGLYLVQYNADVSTTTGTNAQFRVTLNGAEIGGSRVAVTFSAPNQIIAASKSLIAGANAGDVLTVQFTGSSTGVRLSSNSTLTITRIQ